RPRNTQQPSDQLGETATAGGSIHAEPTRTQQTNKHPTGETFKSFPLGTSPPIPSETTPPPSRPGLAFHHNTQILYSYTAPSLHPFQTETPRAAPVPSGAAVTRQWPKTTKTTTTLTTITNGWVPPDLIFVALYPPPPPSPRALSVTTAPPWGHHHHTHTTDE
ncbi:unnamed protein product, partial [Ectocarpus fasciculatus]